MRGSTYGFRVGHFDRTRPLTIDPVLQSTYLGGGNADSLDAVTVHPGTGEVLVVGETYSYSMPGVSEAHLGNGGGIDTFVARFDPELATLLQVAYFGGTGGDAARSIAVSRSSGDVYVAGATSSLDLPGVFGRAQPTYAGAVDGFVVRFDPSLTRLLGATYLGGAGLDRILGIACSGSAPVAFGSKSPGRR